MHEAEVLAFPPRVSVRPDSAQVADLQARIAGMLDEGDLRTAFATYFQHAPDVEFSSDFTREMIASVLANASASTRQKIRELL